MWTTHSTVASMTIELIFLPKTVFPLLLENQSPLVLFYPRDHPTENEESASYSFIPLRGVGVSQDLIKSFSLFMIHIISTWHHAHIQLTCWILPPDIQLCFQKFTEPRQPRCSMEFQKQYIHILKTVSPNENKEIKSPQ